MSGPSHEPHYVGETAPLSPPQSSPKIKVRCSSPTSTNHPFQGQSAHLYPQD
ncbi:hypothetical protein BDV10DRAFT_175540 [Aspergillus recurvatus]